MTNDAAKKLNELVKKKRRPCVCPRRESCESCGRYEQERKERTTTDNQYDPPTVQVLPIPPPYVPPNFDGMYRRHTIYPARFVDANDALQRASSQVRLYEALRATHANTTGVGGVVAQAQATADSLEQLRDSLVPGRRIYQDRRITRETLVNAYNTVMAEAGLAPEPTDGVTKSVLIDRMIDAGVAPGDLRNVILGAYQPFVPPPERATPPRLPPSSPDRSTSTRTQPPPTPPPDV